MIMNVNTWADDYQNYKCMAPWIRKHLPPGEPPVGLQIEWSGSTNRILVHYRYGDLANLGYLSTKQTSIEEVNEFLDGVQRFAGNSTVVIIAEDYPETMLSGVTSPHLVANNTTMAESFWLAERSTHLFTSESGFSQLLRIAANLSAPSFVPTRLYHMNESGQFDTVAGLPLSALGFRSPAESAAPTNVGTDVGTD